MVRGLHVLCNWSTQEAAIALARGDAEAHASVQGLIELIGVHERMHGWDKVNDVQLCTSNISCSGKRDNAEKMQR